MFNANVYLECIFSICTVKFLCTKQVLIEKERQININICKKCVERSEKRKLRIKFENNTYIIKFINQHDGYWYS